MKATEADLPGQARCIHEALNTAGETRSQLLRVNRPPK